jgi:hypothetical protein
MAWFQRDKALQQTGDLQKRLYDADASACVVRNFIDGDGYVVFIHDLDFSRCWR